MAILIPDFIVDKSPIVEIANKYIKQGEYFVRINVLDCQVIDISNDEE